MRICFQVRSNRSRAATVTDRTRRAAIDPQQDDRIAQLESTVAELQREVAALREKIDSLFG